MSLHRAFVTICLQVWFCSLGGYTVSFTALPSLPAWGWTEISHARHTLHRWVLSSALEKSFFQAIAWHDYVVCKFLRPPRNWSMLLTLDCFCKLPSVPASPGNKTVREVQRSWEISVSFPRISKTAPSYSAFDSILVPTMLWRAVRLLFLCNHLSVDILPRNIFTVV